MTYSVYQIIQDKVLGIDDSMTIDNFIDWIVDTKEWDEFLEENNYSDTYGIRKLRHILRQLSIANEKFIWKNFQFIKN